MPTNTRPATAKKPQDHKQSREEIQRSFDETDGAQYLRKLKDIDGFEQMDILAELQTVIGSNAADDDLDESQMDFKEFSRAIRPVITGLIVDEDGFKEWNRGPGAMGRLMNLAVALMNELGKGMDSVTS